MLAVAVSKLRVEANCSQLFVPLDAKNSVHTGHVVQGNRNRRTEALLELVIHLCESGQFSSAKDIVLMVLRRRGLSKSLQFQFFCLAGLMEHRAILAGIESKVHKDSGTISPRDEIPPVGFECAVELLDNSRKGDVAIAKAHLRNAIDLVPDATSIGYALVHLETIDGNWQGAQKVSRSLARAAPYDRDSHLLKAGILSADCQNKGSVESVAEAYLEALQCDPYVSAAVSGLLGIARLENVSPNCQGLVTRGLMRHLEVCHPLQRMPLAAECWCVLGQCLMKMAQDRLTWGKEGEWDRLQPCLEGASSWWGRYHFRTSPPLTHLSMEIESLMLRDKALCALFVLGHDNKYTNWARAAMTSENLDIVVKATDIAKRLNR